MEETFERSVNRVDGLKLQIRKFLRDSYLTISSAMPTPTEQDFSRCLFAHYVFDDQIQQFEKQIKMLKNIGDFVDTATLLEISRDISKPKGRYFHLSFDDGLACLYRNAVPILNKYQVPALVFVNPAVVGDCSDEQKRNWDIATNYKQSLELMDWKALGASGLEVGGHTMNHRRLSDISTDQETLSREIVDCKKLIEENLKTECAYFAWPYGSAGDVDEVSLKALKKAKYRAVFSGFRAKQLGSDAMVFPRHHFEPQWPLSHVKYFAMGGRETNDNTSVLKQLNEFAVL